MLYLATIKYKNLIKAIYWYQFEKEQKELLQIIDFRLNNSGISKSYYYKYDK